MTLPTPPLPSLSHPLVGTPPPVRSPTMKPEHRRNWEETEIGQHCRAQCEVENGTAWIWREPQEIIAQATRIAMVSGVPKRN